MLALILGNLVLLAASGSVRGSQELVTTDNLEKPGSYIKIYTEMYKDTGELDTVYDYYALSARVFDMRPQPHPKLALVSVSFEFSGFAVEAKHEPQTGDYPNGKTCISFSYSSITI